MPAITELTPAEQDILALMADGLTNPEIAERRSTARNTVDNQVARLLLRLGVSNRVQAVRWWLENRGAAA